MSDAKTKYANLQAELKQLGRVLVAFSGGVDSSFLLKAAMDTLGKDNCLAVMGVSPSLSAQQHNQAKDVAQRVDAKLLEVDVHEIEDPNYAANQADRCFHCKTHLFKKLRSVGQEHGFECIVCGNNLDDQGDYRPGQQAGKNLGVLSPLMSAELTKVEIRQLSRDLHLPTADLPASPCLSSRLAYGLEVTIERLGQVEKAEALLRELGFKEFRVRHHDKVARIECHPGDMSKLIKDSVRNQIVRSFQEWGFQFVTVDLQGFRSGALNAMISAKEKEPYQ
ncbi:ATP-dependent sacrificial sulfur transferase LarE [Planctomycetota bacterium]